MLSIIKTNVKWHKLKSYPLWFCCAFSLRSRVKRQNLPISLIRLTQWQPTSIQLVCRRIHLDGLHSQTAVSRVVRCIYLYQKECHQFVKINSFVWSPLFYCGIDVHDEFDNKYGKTSQTSIFLHINYSNVLMPTCIYFVHLKSTIFLLNCTAFNFKIYDHCRCKKYKRNITGCQGQDSF